MGNENKTISHRQNAELFTRKHNIQQMSDQVLATRKVNRTDPLTYIHKLQTNVSIYTSSRWKIRNDLYLPRNDAIIHQLKVKSRVLHQRTLTASETDRNSLTPSTNKSSSCLVLVFAFSDLLSVSIVLHWQVGGRSP